jgi:D-alanyl-D-alanine carboxypeptidase
MKKLPGLKYLILVGLMLVMVIGILVFWHDKTTAPGGNNDTTPKTTNPNPKPSPDPDPKPSSFDKTKYSTTSPSSLWVIVNKKHALPSDYTPELVAVAGGQMHSAAATSLTKLLSDALAAGNSLYIISSYRSYSNQQSTYGGWVERDGVAKADTYSARPGYSEHQTGLAVDLGNGTCDLEICFGDTLAGKWLAGNAYKYGFIIRYPSDKTLVTGYQYEPWHLRYIGDDLSQQMHDQSITTLEEFFDIAGGPNY